jgi:integrase
LYLHNHGKTSASREDIEGFLTSLRLQTPALSAFRIRNTWVALKSFYAWATINHLCPKGNPMLGVKAPKLPKLDIEIYSDRDMENLVNACYRLHHKAIITLFAHTGLRANELLSLTWNQISIEHRAIRVHGKGSKQRIVPFDNACVRYLRELQEDHQSSPENKVFTLSYEDTREMIMRVCGRAGVKYRAIHRFRNTFAVNALNAGMNPIDLRIILGHSSLAMVEHYSHNGETMRAFKHYHEIFDKPR